MLKLFYAIFFVGIYLNCYAETSYVYCANEIGKWKWLQNKDNSYVKVAGYWNRSWLSNNTYIIYFELSDGKTEYLRLKNLCAENFGKEFKIVQPANRKFQDWQPFMVENSYMTNGIFNIYRYTLWSNNSFTANLEKVLLKNIYLLDDPNFYFLTFEDLRMMCKHRSRICW